MLTFRELEIRHHLKITGYVEKVVHRKLISIITLKVGKLQMQTLLTYFKGSIDSNGDLTIISTNLNKSSLLEGIDKILFECNMFTELSLSA